MNGDETSLPDIEEYMASLCEKNGSTDNNSLHTTTSSNDDCSSDEVEILQELKVNLDKHECNLCCEGTFLINKLLQFGGILNDEYKYACDICNTGFKTKADVNKHKKLHEDGALSRDSGIQNVTSFLNASNNSLETSSATPSKTRKKTNSSPPVMCDICLKLLKSEKTLETHKMNMHSNKTFSCEVCDLKFSRFIQFKKHCKIAHTSSQNFLTCPACKKQFLYKKSLRKHVCALNL